jgi:hypothetical protein
VITVSWGGMGLVVYEKDDDGNLRRPLYSAISDAGGDWLEPVVLEMAKRITADETMMAKMAAVLDDKKILIGDETYYDSTDEDIVKMLDEYQAYITPRLPRSQ